jgi:hypothetical protein
MNPLLERISIDPNVCFGKPHQGNAHLGVTNRKHCRAQATLGFSRYVFESNAAW